MRPRMTTRCLGASHSSSVCLGAITSPSHAAKRNFPCILAGSACGLPRHLALPLGPIPCQSLGRATPTCLRAFCPLYKVVLACGHPLRRQTSPLQLSRTTDSGLPHGWPLLKEHARPSTANKESSAILRGAQAGPGGSTVLTTLPTRPEYYMGDDVFRVTLLRRLRFPAPHCPRVSLWWGARHPGRPPCRLRHCWGPRAPRGPREKGRSPNLPRSGRAGCNRRLPPRAKPGAAHH